LHINFRDFDDGLQKNYCRNPGHGTEPWCYVEADGCLREYCDVANLGIYILYYIVMYLILVYILHYIVMYLILVYILYYIVMYLILVYILYSHVW
jgi:hypothetical protein